ncbi:MAG: poly(beta-D-mannuronate) lyase [Paenibacillus sp.]|jgi:poly(beta-D-mannuronate) lyase|nr:poly(beta-D-mannuronate) lyase [Paenibacillus sp.]
MKSWKLLVAACCALCVCALDDAGNHAAQAQQVAGPGAAEGNPHAAQPGEKLVATAEALETAIATAVPGDVITMQDGVWNNIDIVFKGNGTEQKPITLKVQNAGKVIISGASSLQLSGEYLVVDGLHFKDGASSKSLHLIEFRVGSQPANHSRLTNVVVSGFNKNRARTDSTDVWVGLFGSHNRVDHCLFQGKTSESVLMIVWRSTSDPNYHRIDHNYFKDIPSLGVAGATAIRIGDGTHALSSSYTTVENNIFENMQGTGKIVNMKSGGNTIRNNTFINASGSIEVRQGNGNIIEGNFILPAKEERYTGGIVLIGQDHIVRNNYIQGTRSSGRPAIVIYEGEPNNYPGKGGYYPSKNVVIASNTLVDNDKNFTIGELYDPKTEITVPIENLTIKDNVLLGNGSMTPIMIVLDKPNGITYEGNQFFNGNFLGIENVPGITKEQPQLVLGEDGMYHYTDDSPYKRNIATTPLKRTEVGPKWIQANWDAFGIKDTPYVNQPVKNLLPAKPIPETPQEDYKVASESSQDGGLRSDYWYGIAGFAAIAAIGVSLIVRRRSATKAK